MTMLMTSAIGGGFFIQVTADALGAQAAGSPSGIVSTTSGPTFNIVGGIGTLTYSHTVVTPDGTYGTPNISSSTVLSPIFDDTINALDQSNSTWRLTVTDSAARTATADYTVTLQNTSV